MKFNSVKIGNIDYRVEFVDRQSGPSQSDDIVGSHNRTDGIIRVAKVKNRRSEAQTLLHEIVHGIIEGYRVSPLIRDNGKHDENAVDQFATGIDEFLTSLGIKIEDLFEGSDV